MISFARILVAVLGALIFVTAPARATGDAKLRAKVLGAFAEITSYRLTVLGAARSTGVWMAPNRYEMTTDLGGGDPVRTIIIGRDYWTKSGGRYRHAGRVSNNLDVDIAGLVHDARVHREAPFRSRPQTTEDGKRVGTFVYSFRNGTDEACDYDLKTFRVTRCKADEVTILYSDYNDPKIAVRRPQ